MKIIMSLKLITLLSLTFLLSVKAEQQINERDVFKYLVKDKKVKQAESLYWEKKYKKALKLYLNIYSSSPDNSHIFLIKIAECYHWLGNKEKENYYYDLFIHKKPIGYYVRASSYYYLGYYKKAITDFKKALTICPKAEANILYKTGLCYSKLGKQRLAIKNLIRAYKQDPNVYSEIFVDIGNSYFSLKEYKKALKYYIDFVQNIDKDYFEIYLKIGDSYYYLKEFDKAINFYKQAIKACKTLYKNYPCIVGYLSISEILMFEGKIEEAKRNLAPLKKYMKKKEVSLIYNWFIDITRIIENKKTENDKQLATVKKVTFIFDYSFDKLYDWLSHSKLNKTQKVKIKKLTEALKKIIQKNEIKI